MDKLKDQIENLQITAGEYDQLKVVFAEQTSK